ncbi:hypothetical protein [Stenotrophomonas maltophilia]|nr:hypothetical protein [Stenotrophomonas maltophilia]
MLWNIGLTPLHFSAATARIAQRPNNARSLQAFNHREASDETID